VQQYEEGIEQIILSPGYNEGRACKACRLLGDLGAYPISPENKPSKIDSGATFSSFLTMQVH